MMDWQYPFGHSQPEFPTEVGAGGPLSPFLFFSHSTLSGRQDSSITTAPPLFDLRVRLVERRVAPRLVGVAHFRPSALSSSCDVISVRSAFAARAVRSAFAASALITASASAFDASWSVVVARSALLASAAVVAGPSAFEPNKLVISAPSALPANAAVTKLRSALSSNSGMMMAVIEPMVNDPLTCHLQLFEPSKHRSLGYTVRAIQGSEAGGLLRGLCAG